MTIRLAAKALRRSLPRPKSPNAFKPQLGVTVEAASSVIKIPLTHVFVNIAGRGPRALKCWQVVRFQIVGNELVFGGEGVGK